MVEDARKGRHQILGDAEILHAAFLAFANSGFESMSVRNLNAQLGLSHETVRQRFGSKLDLYYAAIDHGVAQFYAILAEERTKLPEAAGDLEELRATARSFITASMRFPGPRCLPAPVSRPPPARTDPNCPATWRPSSPSRGTS